jgi:hypothetical protein
VRAVSVVRKSMQAPMQGLVALLLTVSLVVAAQAPMLAPKAPLTPAPSVLNALREGGYIIYFRHTSTDFGQNDDKMTGFEDCSKQRNLTDAGRAEARAIGAAIRSLRIPIGEVLASPFCRTRETAELIFGRATVSTAVRGGPASEGARYDDLRTLFTRPVSGNVNLAIASHGNPFVAIAGPPYLAEGEAAVIQPLGDSRFSIVARIKKDEWATLR